MCIRMYEYVYKSVFECIFIPDPKVQNSRTGEMLRGLFAKPHVENKLNTYIGMGISRWHTARQITGFGVENNPIWIAQVMSQIPPGECNTTENKLPPLELLIFTGVLQGVIHVESTRKKA